MDFNDMLNEIYDNLKHNAKNKLSLPKVELEITTTNTYWKNAKTFIRQLNRGPDHFVDRMNKEVGETNWKTAKKSDGLVIIGKIKKDKIISFTKGYIKKYVMCQVCKSNNTILEKHTSIRQYQIKQYQIYISYIIFSKCQSFENFRPIK